MRRKELLDQEPNEAGKGVFLLIHFVLVCRRLQQRKAALEQHLWAAQVGCPQASLCHCWGEAMLGKEPAEGAARPERGTLASHVLPPRRKGRAGEPRAGGRDALTWRSTSAACL